MVRDGARAPPHHEGEKLFLRKLVVNTIGFAGNRLNPHPEERRLGRVSKDEAAGGASWFETRGVAALLTMRGKT
jgi:hypothetical protein